MADYLAAGGNLFISGSELAWDLDSASGPSAADRAFFHNQLRAVYSADDANTYTFSPVTNGVFTGNVTSGFDSGAKGTYNVDFPDVLTPTNGSVAALTYVGGTGGTAGITYDGSLGGGKLVIGASLSKPSPTRRRAMLTCRMCCAFSACCRRLHCRTPSTIPPTTL